MRLEAYLKDPCGSSSLPWHKARRIRPPEGLRLVHDRDFHQAMLADYSDEPYFRLRHDLSRIPQRTVPGFRIVQASQKDIPAIAGIISASYRDIRVTPDTVSSWRELPVYDPGLWLTARAVGSGEAAGCAIAEYDPGAREGVLEWVQVLPGFRRRGIGRAMVCALLSRMKEKADFATVSGQINNPENPEALYRACGFTGEDVWHVLRRR